MSSDTAIRVEGLGKRYRIGAAQAPYKTIRESITGITKAPLRWLRNTQHSALGTQHSDTIWALKDVSFEVKRGEVVGIIGRNGAGKSTLLKILSRITEPTEGSAEIHGRVGSLLEVGTGFHPELTGRENIYLNGAILGMRKVEIDRKFDEIVAFAEVDKFIDTPVKHYSSGMHVRLAFAVAAHLQPSILLIDEVLAVGDLEFQKKCIGRMEKIAGEGRTVLVVSHSLSTIRSICARALLLEEGKARSFGQVDVIVAQYASLGKADTAEKHILDKDHLGMTRHLRVKRIHLLNSVENRFAVFWRQPIHMIIEVEVLEKISEVSFGVGFKQSDGTWLLCVHHDDDQLHQRWHLQPGRYRIEFTLENNLKPGFYRLCIGAHHHHYTRNLAYLEPAHLEVLDHSIDGRGHVIYNPGLINGSASWNAVSRIS